MIQIINDLMKLARFRQMNPTFLKIDTESYKILVREIISISGNTYLLPKTNEPHIHNFMGCAVEIIISKIESIHIEIG